MGTWGDGLYEDDTACDVRDSYVQYLKEGLSDAAATQMVLDNQKSRLRGAQVASTIYLALADTQWQYGRLEASIKKRALALLTPGAGVDSARAKVLAALKKRLEGKAKPRRAIKGVPPKPQKAWTDAKFGTVFLLPLSKSSFAALVLVGNIGSGPAKQISMFSVLKWKGSQEPLLSELSKCRFVEVPGLYADSDKNRYIGFLATKPRANPLAGLIRTQIELPKLPKYDGTGFCLDQAKMTELIAAGIEGR
jgi:hypothetical protein